MARLLQQLFETTRRFDMQAQPQLVLLQKTMVVVEGVARSLDPDFDIWEAARPVVERWMSTISGPSAAARGCRGLGALGKLAQHLPQLVRNAEAVSAMLAEGGFRLHPDTARQIAQAQLARNRPVRIALWLAAGALGILGTIWLTTCRSAPGRSPIMPLGSRMPLVVERITGRQAVQHGATRLGGVQSGGLAHPVQVAPRQRRS